MNKERLVTLGSIAFGVAFAFVVLFLTNIMLERKEDSLLRTEENISFSENYEIDGNKKEYQTLTEEEMRQILERVEFSSPWMHEPVKGQINMIEAVEAATELLELLAERGIISETILETGFEGANSSLESHYYERGEYEEYQDRGMPEEEIKKTKRSDRKIDPIYSFWRINMINEAKQTSVILDVHATTGKVWKLYMDTPPENIGTWELNEYLLAYAEYHELEIKEADIFVEGQDKAGVQPEGKFYWLGAENNAEDNKEEVHDWAYFQISFRY